MIDYILMLLYSLVNPEITRGPDDAARRIGESINFTCDATGVPLLVITWSSDSNGNITAQSNVLDDMTIESQITLSNLQLGDFGMYTCTANNPFNVASETALLQCKNNHLLIIYVPRGYFYIFFRSPRICFILQLYVFYALAYSKLYMQYFHWYFLNSKLFMKPYRLLYLYRKLHHKLLSYHVTNHVVCYEPGDTWPPNK